MNKHESTTNGNVSAHDRMQEVIEQSTQQRRAEARRNRNFDRAVMIVSHLIFDGVIQLTPDNMYGDTFQDAVRVVLALLEAFELDSPEKDIVFLKIEGQR